MVILLLHFHRFLLLSTRCYATIETFRRSCTQSTLFKLADLVEPDGALLNMVYHDEFIFIIPKVEITNLMAEKITLVLKSDFVKYYHVLTFPNLAKQNLDAVELFDYFY